MARKIRKSLILTQAPPFTSDSLRVVFGETIPKYNPPGDAEIAELCSILNFWHAHFYRAQEERKFNELVQKAREAFDIINETMPRIWDDLVRRDAAYGGRDFFTTKKLKNARALAPFLTPTALGFLQPYDLPAQAKDWRWLAGVLPADIEKALMTTNPGCRLGNTKGGPLSRILAAIIPLMTGEDVTAIAIGNQLGYNEI